jgi:4-diphosphocytidyl-2-C-methyl-D-erythritol kinase
VTLHEPARAKVNLFLHVVGKRDDGYHLLDSLAVFPNIGDVVSAAPSDTLELRLTGRFGVALVAEPDNLVLRAARALQQLAGVREGATLVLEKNLPVASGIGGGSADAAATLRALCRLWRITPERAALHAIAISLGADVPICLDQRAARMQGVGEILSPAPHMPEAGMVLINPGMSVATPAVFHARSGGFRPDAVLPSAWHDTAAMVAWLGAAHNDLEQPAIGLCPTIGAVLNALRDTKGCLLARMSGSGATCFGLFANPSATSAAAVSLARPGWWTWGGAMCAQIVEHVDLPDRVLRP